VKSQINDFKTQNLVPKSKFFGAPLGELTALPQTP